MAWYANLKIRNKLLAGYGVVVALSFIISYYGVNGMRDLKAHLDDTHDNLLNSIIITSDTDHHSQQHKRELLRYLLASGASSRQEIFAKIKREEGQVKDTFKQLEKMPLLLKEKQLLSSIRLAWETYLEAAARVIAAADEKQNADLYAMERFQLSPLFLELEDLNRQMRSFNVEESDAHYEDGARTYKQLSLWMTGLSLAAAFISLLIAFFITRSVTAPLSRGLAVIQALAQGGEEKARLTEAIANGDLSQDVTPTAPFQIETGSLANDESGTLLKSVASLSATQSQLDLAFARMTSSLRRSREEEKERDWLNRGQNELNALMRGEQKPEEMAEKVLTFLAEYLEAGAGAFYLFDDMSQTLVLTATYAFTRRKKLSDRIQLGEGLIGQTALEKKMICLSNIPPDYLQIGSALGEATPQNIAALPLLHNGELVAALELGLFRPFSHQELNFLQQAMEGIAIGLGVSHSRVRINELLEQTQQQTEELRAQQEELQQTNEELEERAEMLEEQRRQIQATNRGIKTASAELRLKAAELEKVSAFKSEFLANMSHELRTPLNSILLLSRLLTENREGTLTDKQKEFAATINNAGNDLLNLLNDILDLSKVEAGGFELLYEEIALAPFAETIEEMFRPQAEHKGLEFSVIIEPGAPEKLKLDEQRTQQILKNLLSNACKFTEKGTVTLNISSRPGPDNPLHEAAVAFSVRDTGIGIETDKHQLVFQAFQQADGSTSRKFGGTGLGLSISLQLARKMGGELILASEKGRGSVFTLFLPLAGKGGEERATAPAAAQMTPSPQAKTAAPQGPPLAAVTAVPLHLPRPLPDDRDTLAKGDKAILIIEDDLNFAKTLMAMIKGKGFACLVATDGSSGIHLAERYQPSAIILDVMLPGMDGWAVMRSLKDSGATRHIPVHFITCLDERQEGLSMGAAGFFTKPVTSEQLEEVFSNIEKSVEKRMRRLLIIEDNPGAAAGMTNLLQERNLEISVAANGSEAIALLEQEAIDCIVLDLGLPDMSGFDLLEHIHCSEKLRAIPVIIHTGRDLSHEEELKLRHYAKSIILKGAKGPERLLNEVTLFLHMVESDLPREKQQMIRAALDQEAMLAGKKVLLVDDDMRNVFSLSSILAEKDLIVIEAENGKEALARLKEQPDINIVLMDIMMPEMDGYEAMRQIRLDQRFRDLPLIAMTAKAMAGDQERCLQAGANDYISKPLDIDKLLSLLRVWLYRQA